MMTIPVYLGTVLLEKNRWTAKKLPSFKVSEWAPRCAAAGFDGLELWENHVAMADPAEQAALRQVRPPVKIYNSYVTFDDAGASGRTRAAGLVAALGAAAVKFNFGNDTTLLPDYIANLRAWRAQLPARCRLLCECHGGTVLEEPVKAAAILKALDFPVEIIVHALSIEMDALKEWWGRFGPAVTHIHAAWSVSGEGMRKLDLDPARNRERIAFLRAQGFNGTVTLEFTAGVARPDENMDRLLANATDDLSFLRSALA